MGPQGRHAGPIVDDCGIMCELRAIAADANGVKLLAAQEVLDDGHSESGGCSE
jgi:hypothetical protein